MICIIDIRRYLALGHYDDRDALVLPYGASAELYFYRRKISTADIPWELLSTRPIKPRGQSMLRTEAHFAVVCCLLFVVVVVVVVI
jgi:hypothetical protein